MNYDINLEKLNTLIQHSRKSDFYRKIIPDKRLNSFDDFKKLPFTTKDNLREYSPFGFVCVPREDLFQYHESFGTTGVPASTWLTKEDFIALTDSVNEVGTLFNAQDIVLIRFPYAISSVSHFVHKAAQVKDACIVPVSSRTSVSPFKRVVNLLKTLDVTVLAAMPLQAILIAETAELMGLKPTVDFPKLRLIYTAGEALTPQKKKVLKKLWNIPIRDNYGMTETGVMAVDCQFGSLHPFENRFLFEILDDKLKTDVKLGETGNLVITTLERKACPLIRYITGDRVKMVNKPCLCGRHTIMEIHGRANEIVNIDGCILDLWDLQDMISYLPYQRFWIAGILEGILTLVVEVEDEYKEINKAIIKNIEEKYKTKVRIDVVPKGTLCDRSQLLSPGSAGKPKYIYSPLEMQNKVYLNKNNNLT